MTAASRVPVLWICGPSGAGKSTVSWQLYTELASTGVHVAFADSDQLCMCYPATPGDPGRQHLRALNTGSLIENFRSAGAQCVIVNGVLDPGGLETSLLPDAEVTICRLRADKGVVERRLIARDGRRDDMSLMDQSSCAHACVDTTDVAAGEVAEQVRAACKDWPGFTGELENPASPVDVKRGPAQGGGRVILITGPTGVGKSTIGFRFYLKCLNAGFTVGYVDLRQIGFLRPTTKDPDNQRLKARNLAAVWRNYRAAGATHLVATGTIASNSELQPYTAELDGADLTLTRLRAQKAELRLRVRSRGGGGSWPEPGDRLAGQSARFLASVADQAIAAAEALDRSAFGGVAVDTTGLSPDESADLLSKATGWLNQGAGGISAR